MKIESDKLMDFVSFYGEYIMITMMYVFALVFLLTSTYEIYNYQSIVKSTSCPPEIINKK